MVKLRNGQTPQWSNFAILGFDRRFSAVKLVGGQIRGQTLLTIRGQTPLTIRGQTLLTIRGQTVF